jgi:hypothetical protein
MQRQSLDNGRVQSEEDGEAVVAYSMYYSGTCLEVLRKITKPLIRIAGIQAKILNSQITVTF